MIDTKALREIATAATQGPWRVEAGTTLIWGACSQDDTTTYGMGYPIAEARVSPSNPRWAPGPSADEGEANASHIATFDPPTVVAMLDEIDRLRALIGRAGEAMKRLGSVEAFTIPCIVPGDFFPEMSARLDYARTIAAEIEEALK